MQIRALHKVAIFEWGPTQQQNSIRRVLKIADAVDFSSDMMHMLFVFQAR